MKKIFFLIFTFLSIVCFGQNPPQKINANYQFQSHGSDSSDRLPKSRASNPVFVDTGMIYYNKSDKKIHWLTSLTEDTTINPAQPPRSVQWGDGNNFRGVSNFIFDTLTNTVLMNADEIGKQGFIPNKTLSTQRLYDSSYQILNYWPTIQGELPGPNTFGNFRQGIDQTFINPDGQRDATLFTCYNCVAKGVHENANEVEMDRTIESHFFATGFEMYDQFTYPSSLGNTVVRPFGYNQPFGSVRDNNLLFHFDQYNFFNEPGGINNFSFRKDGHFRMIGVFPEATLGVTDSSTGGGFFIQPFLNQETGTEIFSSSDASHFAPTTVLFGLNVKGSVNEASWSIESVTSAGYNMSQDTSTYLVDPPALLASFAYILPGLARDGQIIDIYAGGHVASGTVVTSFTVAPNVGFGQTIISNTSFTGITLSAGQHIRLKFQALNSRWYNSN